MSNKKFGTRYTTQSFIEKARTIHNNLYEYSNVVYINSFTKIRIFCHKHGMFEQRPCDHINQKHGCPKCSHNYPYTIDDIRRKSKQKYGDKYSILDPFVGIKHQMSLICNEDSHGKFTLKIAEIHFQRNGGCPKCALAVKLENLKPGNISKVEKLWLDSLNVPIRQHKIVVNDRTFIVDGFDPLTNTVYECYGSYWHGNPNRYNPIDMNTVLNKTYGELYQKTMIKESLLKTQFTVISKWV